jgi:hypothetical protein
MIYRLIDGTKLFTKPLRPIIGVLYVIVVVVLSPIWLILAKVPK